MMNTRLPLFTLLAAALIGYGPANPGAKRNGVTSGCLSELTGVPQGAGGAEAHPSLELRSPRVMVRAEIRAGGLREQYFARRGNAWIEVATAGRAIGVNGLNVSECSVKADRIQLSLSSPYQWKRPPVIVFRQIEP